MRFRKKPSHKVALLHARLDQQSNEALMIYCLRHKVNRTQAVTHALRLLAQEENLMQGPDKHLTD